MKWKLVYAVALFMVCFLSFNTMAERYKKPQTGVHSRGFVKKPQLCDWSWVTFQQGFDGVQEWVQVTADCPSGGEDGCYMSVASDLYFWSTVSQSWVLLPSYHMGSQGGPLCEHVGQQFYRPVELDTLIGPVNYCLVMTAYNDTFGHNLIGSTYNYFAKP